MPGHGSHLTRPNERRNISIVLFFEMTSIVTHRVDGTGPALVLLNGGLMSMASWEPMLGLLGARFRFVRCDFRGQLLSPGGAHPAMVDHAADVVALLDHLGIDRAHLVGPSFGGVVAMLVAARFPSRVASLVVATATDRLTTEMLEESRGLREAALAAAAGGDRSNLFRVLAPNTFSPGWLATQPEGFVEMRAAQIAMLPLPFFEGVAGLMRALDTLDLGDELPRITAPTLVIGAELDRVFPVEHSRAIARAIPGARLEIIEGAGHAAVVETPEAFARLVAEFVAGIEAR